LSPGGRGFSVGHDLALQLIETLLLGGKALVELLEQQLHL
jgi:hypothetical protein